MLSDRSYMREPQSERGLPVLAWLISAIIGAFLIQIFTSSTLLQGDPAITTRLAVTINGLKELRLWTIGTYSLLHSTDNLVHIFGVVGGLFLLGRALIPVLGPSRFLGIYFGSVALGALVWAAVNWEQGGVLIGGAAGVYGLIALYACLYPNVELSFLFFFVFPVTIKPKHLACGLALADILACIYYEVLGAKAPFAYSASAHLGGLAAGLLYYRIACATPLIANNASEEPTPVARTNQKSGKSSSPSPQSATYSNRREEMRIEVDRILDKINSTGLASLTVAEKRFLDEAKSVLTKG